MLKVMNISKTYGDHVVLQNISFTLSPGERVGLIGPNGCGKTTLLNIVMGRESAETGRVQLGPGTRVGYLAQGLAAADSATVQDCLNLALGDLAHLESEVERCAAALTTAPDQPAAQQAYAAALANLQAAGAGAGPGEIETTLGQLGLGGLPYTTPVGTLSGGQKTRLALALVLLARPHLLLLDEPTNHLDLEMLAWLEDWLVHLRGAVLLVSHDRAFLDNTVSAILELDPQTHQLRPYPGNYSDYAEAKEREREQQWQTYQDQQKEIGELRQAANRLRGVAKPKRQSKAGGDKFARGFFNNRMLEVTRRAKQLERRLERIQAEGVDKPASRWQMKLDFATAAASGQVVAALEDLAVGYTAPLLQNIVLLIRAGERVALIGRNGSGKTTLARTLAGQLPPLAGRVRLGARVQLGYFDQEQELLDPALNVLTTLQQHSRQPETELRQFLHCFLFTGDEVFTPVGSLSYGERARLRLAVLVAQGCNFLLLDEPINHLDLAARERFEQALTAFTGTVLAIVHDRYFIERIATRIWQVEGQGVTEVWRAG